MTWLELAQSIVEIITTGFSRDIVILGVVVLLIAVLEGNITVGIPRPQRRRKTEDEDEEWVLVRRRK